MPLPSARDDRLLVLVFGPGTGELILVRAPGNEWLVVDGCAKSGARRAYAQLALAHYGARPAVIVMTHPHRDHAYGLADLIEEATHSEPWPLLGLLPPILPSGSAAPGTPAAHAAGIAERAISAIEACWAARPSCRWDLSLGSTRALGPVTLTVVSPVGFASNPNERSTALLVEWEGVHVVLGADLEPTASWRDTLSQYPQAAWHQGLKVAHHGSIQAQEPTLFAPSPAAARVITPYAASSLPRFDSGGGVALHLASVAQVHLTALPRAHALQGGPGPATLPRSTLEAAPGISMDPPVSDFPDCFVALEWDSAGLATIHHGPGAVIVTP